MIQLTILFDEKTGRIDVTGPINNKVLSLGLLEFAKHKVSEFDPAKAQADQRIKLATADVLNPRNGNGGSHAHH